MINITLKESVWYDSKKTIQSLICKLRTLCMHLHEYRAIIRLIFYSSQCESILKQQYILSFTSVTFGSFPIISNNSSAVPIKYILVQHFSFVCERKFRVYLRNYALRFLAKVTIEMFCERKAVIILQKSRFYSQILNWFPKITRFCKRFAFIRERYALICERFAL